MAIPRTNLHNSRVADQIRLNLIQLQQDMVRNALAHKAMAQAQSPPLATLATFIADTAASYLTRLQWVIDLQADPIKKARLVAIITSWGWTEADITDVVVALRQAAIGLRDAQRTTYAQVITACDALLAFVAPPDSLWPE